MNGSVCCLRIVLNTTEITVILRKQVCLSLDTETVNYDHYLRLGGALNFEFSLKKKENIYIQLGGPSNVFCYKF